jgi:hypothetical protein
METLSSAAALLPLAAFAMGTIGNTGCAVLGQVRRGALPAHQPLAILLVLAAGCVVLALAGLLVALAPMGRRYIAWALLIGINVACAAANWRGRRVLPVEAATVRRYFGVWGPTSLVCLLFAFAPTNPPAQFVDGPYVYKKWVEFVRIQRLTGDLPPDNAVPAFVAEYLVRGISFAAERPIMPGQEVANRPILMALVYLPFRAALGEQTPTIYPLPRFDYVGTSWPDASVLVTDFNFRQFLAIGIVLNGLAVLAFLALLESLGVRRPIMTAVLVALTSIYVFIQTIFTWPKSFAAFFIVAAWLALRDRRPVALAAALMGAAYWAHPYALAFAASAGLCILLHSLAEARHDPGCFKAPLLYAAVFGLLIAPWFIWTQGVLGIEGDLIGQNPLRQEGLLNHMWIREVTLARSCFPAPLVAYPFVWEQFLREWPITLASAMGALLFFAPAAIVLAQPRERELAVYGALLPGVLVILPFSYVSVPMLHGWQAAWLIVAAVTLASLQEWISRRGLLLLVLAQAVVNVIIVMAHLYYHVG